MAADTAFFQGIIDTPQRLRALQMQFTLSQLITAGRVVSAELRVEGLGSRVWGPACT